MNVATDEPQPQATSPALAAPFILDPDLEAPPDVLTKAQQDGNPDRELSSIYTTIFNVLTMLSVDPFASGSLSGVSASTGAPESAPTYSEVVQSTFPSSHSSATPTPKSRLATTIQPNRQSLVSLPRPRAPSSAAPGGFVKPALVIGQLKRPAAPPPRGTSAAPTTPRDSSIPPTSRAASLAPSRLPSAPPTPITTFNPPSLMSKTAIDAEVEADNRVRALERQVSTLLQGNKQIDLLTESNTFLRGELDNLRSKIDAVHNMILGLQHDVHVAPSGEMEGGGKGKVVAKPATGGKKEGRVKKEQLTTEEAQDKAEDTLLKVSDVVTVLNRQLTTLVL